MVETPEQEGVQWQTGFGGGGVPKWKICCAKEKKLVVMGCGAVKTGKKGGFKRKGDQKATPGARGRCRDGRGGQNFGSTGGSEIKMGTCWSPGFETKQPTENGTGRATKTERKGGAGFNTGGRRICPINERGGLTLGISP